MRGSLRPVMVALALAFTCAVPGSAAPAKEGKPRSVVGTLQKVDGRTITVQTPKGTEVVTLVSTSRIQRGASTLEPSSLASFAGVRVKVRYLENNGEKQAQTVTLASVSRAAASAGPAKPAANVSTTTVQK